MLRLNATMGALSLLFSSITGIPQEFTEVPTTLIPIRAGSHVWGDFDNDGDLDVIVSGTGGSEYSTRIYLNDGSGGFVEVPGAFPAQMSGTLAVADFDRDGRLDVLVGVNLFRNEGSGKFTLLTNALPGVSSGICAWGDFNNDGSPDVLYSGGSLILKYMSPGE